MGGKAYLNRIGVGFAGAVSRQNDLTIEPVYLDESNPFSAFGLAGKYSNNKFVPLAAGDTISSVVGFLVRPYPAHSQADLSYLGITAAPMGDKLARGYVTLQTGSDASAAVKGAPVYVRVAGATSGSPLGSIVLTPDATATNTPQLTNASVMGPGDATGIVEIAYNI